MATNNNNNNIEIVTQEVEDGHTSEKKTITYSQCTMVGHGSFGMVFKGQLIPSNELIAIKRVLQDKRFKNRELQIMKMLKHKNVVDLKCYFYQQTDNNDLYLNLVLDFMPETLYKALHFYTLKKTHMPLFEVKLYSYQLLRSLEYIHSLGICHRDIKPPNLLVNPETGVLKICDFGSAKILNPQEPNVSYICSRYYRAPELIFGATNYTTKIDVWSAGCVIAEMILGQPLFPGESGIDQLVEIIKVLGTPTLEDISKMNPEYMEHTFPPIKSIPLLKIFKNNLDQNLVELLNKILVYNPIERITLIQGLKFQVFDVLKNSNTTFKNQDLKNLIE